jgi:chromate reductase
MGTYKIGYFVGSLAKESINRTLSQALVRLAPEKLEFTEIPIGDLPLYSYDYDADFPPQARALKEGIESSDGILFVSPEYNRSIPGALKNAIDWGSRPWGTNSFARKPTGIIGASPGSIGTAVMQSSMRSVLSFLDAPQLNAPEVYLQFDAAAFGADGEVCVWLRSCVYLRYGGDSPTGLLLGNGARPEKHNTCVSGLFLCPKIDREV